MNELDKLLKKTFFSYTLEEILEIKRLGPHHPSLFELKTSDKKQSRTFSLDWFSKKTWLTPSQEKNSLFCFYCVLFGGEPTWTRIGFRDMKHLSERIKKHETSSRHLQNALNFQTFGSINIKSQIDSGYAASINKHKEIVKKNRHVLSRMIDILKFCGGHNLSLRGHDEREESSNRGIFLDMVSYTRSIDNVLDDYLQVNRIAQNTSKTIQNELLECIYLVYEEEIKKEIEAANFVSIQADETTDISCTSQMAIILRYVKDEKPVERFLSFYDLHDRTAKGMVCVIENALSKFNLKEKLISQTYDGAAVMSGINGGVQKLLKNNYPYALFVHCYAHQLNLVLKQASSSIKEVRIFFANVSGFSSFFSSSPKRKDIFIEVCQKKGLPKSVETRWNFHSRVVQSVYESRDNLKHCFQLIQIECWDSITLREATGLLNLLEDEEFNFFLDFFNKIYSHVDILYNILQSRNTSGVFALQSVDKFCTSINSIRNSLNVNQESNFSQSKKRIRTSISNLTFKAKEVCDIITTQVKERFNNFEHICSFSIADPKKFSEYSSDFPTENLNKFCECYPFIEKTILKNELTVIYSNEIFRDMSSVSDIFKFFKENNLSQSFQESIRMFEIILTSPISTSESERVFNTLKDIKTYKSSTMGQNRLNSLAVLSICRDFILNIPNFNEKCIDIFARQKNRRAEYLFK